MGRFDTEFPYLLGSTNPCPTAVSQWNLSPLRPSKFSFQYLLLPPRSAPAAAPRPPRPPTRRDLSLAPTAECGCDA